MLRILFVFSVMLTCTMCASTKQYTLNDLPDERLEFSFGGGFTGEYSDYILLPNGQLYSRRRVVRNTSFRELQAVDKQVAKDLFRTFEKQDFASLSYNEPGSMTYTLMHITAPDTAKLVWGGPEVKPTEALRTYWRRLMGEVSTKEPLPADM